MRTTLFLEIAIILFVMVAGSAASARAPLNVLILLADDLGYMDLGCYNPSTFYETPHLDRFAGQSTRFTQGYAANPVCSPTRYSIMTGKYPSRIGLTNWLPGGREGRFVGAPLTLQMPLEETTLAELLLTAGYRTAFVGKWHLGEEERYWPEGHGFEVNIGGYSGGHPKSYFSPYGNPRLEDGPRGEHLDLRLAEETVALLKHFKERGERFVLHHCFYGVHTPLRAPVELVEKYRRKADGRSADRAVSEGRPSLDRGRRPRQERTEQSDATYAAMVETMDTAAGRILDALDQLGLAETTLVIFTSDNGGLSTTGRAPTSNAPLRAGKGWVYEGGIREPYLVRMPGSPLLGKTCDLPIVSMDIFNTALEAAGVSLPRQAVSDGQSLLPLLLGGPPPAREAIFWHYPHYSNQGGFPAGAIRLGNWKLVEDYEEGSVELFDLHRDAGEQHDLSEADPDRTRDLRARLHTWYREVGAQFLRPKPGGPTPWSP